MSRSPADSSQLLQNPRRSPGHRRAQERCVHTRDAEERGPVPEHQAGGHIRRRRAEVSAYGKALGTSRAALTPFRAPSRMSSSEAAWSDTSICRRLPWTQPCWRTRQEEVRTTPALATTDDRNRSRPGRPQTEAGLNKAGGKGIPG
jgi:hypothetical protein